MIKATSLKRKTIFCLTFVLILISSVFTEGKTVALKDNFKSPPDSARPGVYWYFMDGNMDKEEMTADLESMKEVGIGNLVFLEVNIGVPRGPVDFMSEQWQEYFAHAVHEAERLGIEITLGSGPGWTGSGGPWVKPEQSMQHLVASSVKVKGGTHFRKKLPVPPPRKPFFHSVTEELEAKRQAYYEDVAVLAYPSIKEGAEIEIIDEKALYYRAPYSGGTVKPYLPAPAEYPSVSDKMVIDMDRMIDLTDKLDQDGRLDWEAPAGNKWTIMRFVSRNNGANTRPAPNPGYGFECDKFNADAMDEHLKNYTDKLIAKVGPRKPGVGWTMLHIDSWEMGAQNWTQDFREQFRKRRGYDPQPYYPAYTGLVVGSVERTERFLWDLRLTGQELILEKHAEQLKSYAHKHGFGLSIEPYDMNPGNDLDLGAVADVPMCEFWSPGAFNTTYSCLESASIAHTMGRPIIAAEAFTEGPSSSWQQYPGSMKNQGDWAFCIGINRLVYHTFAHKPLGEEYRPGMQMGPYGVQWDRGQTWWPMVSDYHRYITRCSYMLRQGVTVADILYLTPGGAPQVFTPPSSALDGEGLLVDKRGYSFDGCSPKILIERAEARNGRISFPGGTSYRLLVLPAFDTMLPSHLEKIEELVLAGATVVGYPPIKSPSLMDYPECDGKLQEIALRLWGSLDAPEKLTKREYGKGKIYWGGPVSKTKKGKTAKPLTFNGCPWIWDSWDTVQPPGKRYFRKEVKIPADAKVIDMKVMVTADNSFDLYINGKKAGGGTNFNSGYSYDLTNKMQSGTNVLAIAAVNGGSAPNPGGLVGCYRLELANGKVINGSFDKKCKIAKKDIPGWNLSDFDDSSWRNAEIICDFGAGPWGNYEVEASFNKKLYPTYEVTAELLAGMNVPEDFTSTGPIRYTHRRTEEHDIYFVSNRSPDIIEADCVFRNGGRQPELWIPLTGEIRRISQYKHSDNGQTTIPMQFNPHESFFVVFSRRQTGQAGSVKDVAVFPQFKSIAEVSGSWDVSFDPKWGGPEKIVFNELTDWTKHKDKGIKYYSGIATYSKMFDLPDGQSLDSDIYLDLGVIKHMSRVRLNGKDLGVIWTSPWRVNITDAVKAKGNKLEVEVANLWTNRLLGDIKPAGTAQWPSGLLEGRKQPRGKYTFTTKRYEHLGMSLLKSGLLGPVTLQITD